MERFRNCYATAVHKQTAGSASLFLSPSPAAPRRRLHPPQGAARPGPAVCWQPVGEAGPGGSLSPPDSLCGAGNRCTHSASPAAPRAPSAARSGHEPGVRREGPGGRERRSVRGGTQPPPRLSSAPRGPLVPGGRGARLEWGRERAGGAWGDRSAAGGVGGARAALAWSAGCWSARIASLPLLCTVPVSFFLPFCRDGLKLETEVLDGKPRLILAASGIFWLFAWSNLSSSDWCNARISAI